MRYTLPLGLLVFTTACLKEIEVDVPTDTGELVVEAYYNSRDSAFVRVSRTTKYFGASRPPLVSNAWVVLEDLQAGTRDTLRWRDTAYFRITRNVQPTAGHTYKLVVRTEDEEAQATCVMPQTVPLDTVFVIYRPAVGRLPEGYRGIGIAQDPPGAQNAYRARIWRNDTLFNRIFDWFYSDDRFIDGRLIVFEFPYALQPGDTFSLEIMSIPQDVIQYYEQVVRNAFGGSGGFSPPPDNAYSNFTSRRRRVWGYFIAYATDSKGARVPR
ncbi:MAG: DUF4249 domain-containing protein [Bacteroidia bacterium]|nr:DUF4249 domain-containing protein [Bacteroidia bacterium]